jgi:hypothetical protein
MKTKGLETFCISKPLSCLVGTKSFQLLTPTVSGRVYGVQVVIIISDSSGHSGYILFFYDHGFLG